MGNAPSRIRQQRMRVSWSRLFFRPANVMRQVFSAIWTDGEVLLRVAHRLVVCRHGMMLMMVGNGGGPSGSPLCCASRRARRTAFRRRPYALLRPR